MRGLVIIFLCILIVPPCMFGNTMAHLPAVCQRHWMFDAPDALWPYFVWAWLVYWIVLGPIIKVFAAELRYWLK